MSQTPLTRGPKCQNRKFKQIDSWDMQPAAKLCRQSNAAYQISKPPILDIITNKQKTRSAAEAEPIKYCIEEFGNLSPQKTVDLINIWGNNQSPTSFLERTTLLIPGMNFDWKKYETLIYGGQTNFRGVNAYMEVFGVWSDIRIILCMYIYKQISNKEIYP